MTKTSPSAPAPVPPQPVKRKLKYVLNVPAFTLTVLNTLPACQVVARTRRRTFPSSVATVCGFPFTVNPCVLEKSGNRTKTLLCAATSGGENPVARSRLTEIACTMVIGFIPRPSFPRSVFTSELSPTLKISGTRFFGRPLDFVVRRPHYPAECGEWCPSQLNCSPIRSPSIGTDTSTPRPSRCRARNSRYRLPARNTTRDRSGTASAS